MFFEAEPLCHGADDQPAVFAESFLQRGSPGNLVASFESQVAVVHVRAALAVFGLRDTKDRAHKLSDRFFRPARTREQPCEGVAGLVATGPGPDKQRGGGDLSDKELQ